MKNKIFIFDLDDTLYKEIDFLYSAYLEIAGWIELKFSLKGIYVFMLEAYKEKADVFSRLIDTYDLSLTKTDLLSVYRSHRPDIRLELDTLKALEILKQDFTLGMITDGRFNYPTELSSEHWDLNNLSETKTWSYPKSLALKNRRRGILCFFRINMPMQSFSMSGIIFGKILSHLISWGGERSACWMMEEISTVRNFSCQEEYLPW